MIANLCKLLYYMSANRDFSLFLLSSSTRRTWIEILFTLLRNLSNDVVLHTEDVD